MPDPEQLPDPNTGLTQELPSQPDIPAPELVPEHFPTSHAAAAAQLGYHVFPEHIQPYEQEPVLFAEAPMLVVPTAPPMHEHQGSPDGDMHHGHASKGRGAARGRATRRGPMDEMRQLVRILVKVIPHSSYMITNAEEGGGGNRISERQISAYLDNTLGEAPRPNWGVPNGWGEYLAGGSALPLYTCGALESDLAHSQHLRHRLVGAWSDGPCCRPDCMHA